jgi:glycosyltransferase involved in cell wall biosynthesis
VKITVIVPAYNAQKYIDKCINALLNQSYLSEDYEVIVVDDGSSDKTADIIRGYQVRYMRQRNKGPAAARNRGAREARGEIILFTDADCVPRSNWVEEMVKPFRDPEVMAVKGAYKTDQKTLIARFVQIEFEERFEMLKKAESIDMIDTYSAGYRKSIFLALGGFDTSFPVANNEDTELSYKMSNAGHKMVFNPNAVVYHLNHPDSIKKYVKLKYWRGYWRMIVYKKYPDKMLKDSYTPQILKLQILLMMIFLISLPLVVFFGNPMLYPLMVSIFLFILVAFPFIKLSLQKGMKFAFLSPFFLAVRAASLGLGVIFGMLLATNSPKDDQG